MTTTASTETLRTLLPPDRYPGIEAYAIDGALPALAVRPANREEAARVIAAADSTAGEGGAGLVVVPLGARTQTALGRPLARYDIALDTTALTRLIHYEPNDLTVTVEAGMTLAELQRTLAVNSQYLPADPPPSDRVTIGGLLATARPGAWRHHMPGQRDLVLGITSVQPDGTLTHSGGRVVKNVSGYDLHRMHTGALGAFGVIVEATFKLAPTPPATRTLGVECETLTQAAEVAAGLWDLALPLRALTVLTPTAAEAAGLPRSAMVLLEAFGNDAVLARVGEAVRQAAMATRSPRAGALPNEAWARLRALAGDSSQVVLRLGAPSSKVAEVAQAAAQAGCIVWAHLAAGSILAVAPDLAADAVRALRATARERGGFLQIESAPSALRREVDPFDLTERTLVAALKREFDPRGTLNRGRWQEDV